jgi:SPP1 gp7 family putative phage head morphogenesis protein
MRIQLRYEKQYIKTLKPIFKQQEAEALENLEAHASEYLSDVSKAAQQKLFDDSYYDQLMTTKLQPLLQDLTNTQGGLALVFAGDDENEFHLTSNMIQYLQRNTLKMATNYNDQTLDQLNTTLAEGIEAGEGIGDLKNRIKEVYDEIDSYRATRVARTETLKASNNATVEAYRQTGFVKNKVWVVNPDACSQCEEFNGKSVPLDDSFLPLGGSYTVTDEEGNETTFTNNYDTIEEPPLHPNCRCTIIPEA